MKPTTLPLMVILVALLATACGDDTRGVSPTGPTESGGIVVESTELKSETDCGGSSGPCFDSCHVRGTVRNDTAMNRKVTLKFTAFDGKGNAIDSTTANIANSGIVPAGGRSTYRAGLLFFEDCDRVARLEITELKLEPVA